MSNPADLTDAWADEAAEREKNEGMKDSGLGVRFVFFSLKKTHRKRFCFLLCMYSFFRLCSVLFFGVVDQVPGCLEPFPGPFGGESSKPSGFRKIRQSGFWVERVGSGACIL